ncbi:MAG: transketolase [Synergistaceae bacterium]|jgi:transketolase|nr:transketolase [Synergistaceae bacterium]
MESGVLTKSLIRDIEDMAARMRKSALDMAFSARGSASHIGAGMSIIDILAVLYGGVMKLNKSDPLWGGRDRFILSKGHGVLGYYAALAEVGYLSKKDLETFEKPGTFLAGHPVKNLERGIEFTNGSLGMGLSLGVGVALAMKKKGNANKVYVLMGDGECNEGSVWEAVMSAAQFKLDNLVAIADCNSFQLGGRNEDIMSVGDMAEKARSFGWSAVTVDGHDAERLYESLTASYEKCKPLMIAAMTIKGKGFSLFESDNRWHHAMISKSQYDSLTGELERPRQL